MRKVNGLGHGEPDHFGGNLRVDVIHQWDGYIRIEWSRASDHGVVPGYHAITRTVESVENAIGRMATAMVIFYDQSTLVDSD